MDWYPDDSTTSPPVHPGVGLLGAAAAALMDEERGRLVCCCGSCVWRRCGVRGLPRRSGSRSPLPDPDPGALLRRLCRLVPRLIVAAATPEPRPAAGGTTGAERGSDSGRRGGPEASSSGAEGEAPLADATDEDEEDDEEGTAERERRLR